MRRKLVVAAFFLALVQTLVVASQPRRPAIYIDKRLCPGEGCRYEGRPKVLRRTTVYAGPGAKSRRLFQLVPGETVTTLDSQVHTIAGRFVVKRAHEKYSPGDVIWVYTYLGEGLFRIWYRGNMYTEDLEFSPWGGASGNRCEQEERYCWGQLDKKLQMSWWLKVRDKRGRQGWIHVSKNLDWGRE